jgi:hypothetical protein
VVATVAAIQTIQMMTLVTDFPLVDLLSMVTSMLSNPIAVSWGAESTARRCRFDVASLHCTARYAAFPKMD